VHFPQHLAQDVNHVFAADSSEGMRKDRNVECFPRQRECRYVPGTKITAIAFCNLSPLGSQAINCLFVWVNPKDRIGLREVLQRKLARATANLQHILAGKGDATHYRVFDIHVATLSMRVFPFPDQAPPWLSVCQV
jgi:hypothetical protein